MLLIMAHVVNHVLLSGYLLSVYKFKRSYKYASAFRNVMFNLITELFWNNIQVFHYFKIATSTEK